MPRPQRAYGRPGTTVFPTGWDTDHAAVIDRTHTATVTVAPPGAGRAWNPATRQTETQPAAAVYAGAASISPASLGGAAARLDVADEQVDQSKYAITLTHEAPGITPGMVVTVTGCPGDTDLVGRTMRVEAVELGSGRFARHLTCTLT